VVDGPWNAPRYPSGGRWRVARIQQSCDAHHTFGVSFLTRRKAICTKNLRVDGGMVRPDRRRLIMNVRETNEIRGLTAVELDEVAGSCICEPIGQKILQYHQQEVAKLEAEKAAYWEIYYNIEM
jgi:hypothetical protein